MDIRRVVVVDDHQMFTEALSVTLSAEADLRVVGRSTLDDPDLPALLARVRPDVLTVDVGPLGPRFTEVIGRLVAARPEVKVVVLTASRDVEQVIEAARAGADAWLSKESPSAELVATIRAVCAGHACYPSAHLGAVLRALRAGAPPSPPERDLLAQLSRQERRVLAGMVDGATGPDLAAVLQVSLGTVRSHIHHVFTKLGVHSRLEAVKVARAAGMRPNG